VAPLTYDCPAKINLVLEVLRRRGDGYHDLASVVLPITLADSMEVWASDDIDCVVHGMALATEANLVIRAARLLAEAVGATAGARCILTKRIPAAAGLGGGSSDAAGALGALNRLWGSGLSRSRLMELGAQLGSDVPFFVHGGPALVRGRGEIVEGLARSPALWLVLVIPAHGLADKTRALFAALEPGDCSDGRRTDTAARLLARTGRVDGLDLVNAFERAARSVFPGLGETWQAVEERVGRPFHLSGAGPALFAFAADEAEARALAARLAGLDAAVYAAQTLAVGPDYAAAGRMRYA